MELVADVVTTIVQKEWTTYRVVLVRHADGKYRDMHIEPVTNEEIEVRGASRLAEETELMPPDYYI